MTSKTEVAKEVSEVLEVAEKGGTDKSSYRGLPIADCNRSSDHNQACDLDKSYVFVNGADEFINDAGSEKDGSVSPKSEAAGIVEERGNGELDVTTEDVIKPMNDGSIGDRPIENGGSGEYESSQVGIEDGVSAFEKSGKAEVEQTEAGVSKEKVGDQNGTAEGVTELGTFGDLQKSEIHPSPEENQESVAGASEFPTESAANEEITKLCEDKIVLDECVHQNDESSVEISQMSERSEVGVVDMSLVPEDEEKLAVEVMEATEQEVLPLTCSELYNKEERLNGDSKTTSQLDMDENQQLDMSGDGSSLGLLEQGNLTTNMVSSVKCLVESVNNLALEEKNEESFASHVAREIQHPEEPVKCNDGSELPSETIQAEVKAEVLESDETLPVLHCENPDAAVTETDSALSVDGKTMQVMDSGLPDNDQIINGTLKVESSRPDPTVDGVVTQEEADAVVVLTEKEPTLQVAEGAFQKQGAEGAAESVSLSGLAEVSNSQPATLDVKLEPEVHIQTFSAVRKGEKTEILSGTRRTEVIDSLATENGSVDNADVGIEDAQKNQNMGDKFVGAAEDSQENVFLSEHKLIGESSSCRAEATDNFNTENGSVDNAVVVIEDVPKNQNMGDKFDGAAEDSQENVFLAEPKVIGETGSCRAENGSVDNAVVGIGDVQTNQNMGDKFDSAAEDYQENEVTGESETVGANAEPEVHVHDFSATSTGEKTNDMSGPCRTEVIDSFNVVDEDDADSGLGIEDVQSMGGLLEGVAGITRDNVFQENEATGKSESFNVNLPEVDGHDLPAITSSEEKNVVSGAHEAEVLDSSNSGNEGVVNSVAVIEITNNMSDSGPAGVIHENECLQENGAAGESVCDNKSGAESEGSMPNTCFREEASVITKTKPFNFLVRVPRFDDDNLKEQIRLAKLNVDEKTKLRDAIQVQIQEKRASNQIHGVDYELAKEEGRSARKLVRSKRMEIDSLQSMINKAKNALSIEDIDSQIHNMEHMIQHETLPLKEEKQFIREIKQLKQLREQLSSNLGSRAEIKNALEQREEVEERLKMLRKELDVLKDSVLKAEAAAVEAGKRYDDENKKVKELQAQFRAADDVRQSAYAQWQNLRKELSKKNKYFFKYKDTAAVANNYAFSGSSEALYCLCTDNVQNFMELWNTDDEFRKEYIKSNVRSTIRRLGTFDGRSLGSDEQPIILPKYVDDRNSSLKATQMKVDVAPQTPVKEVQQEKTNEIVASNSLPRPKVTEHRKQKIATEEPAAALIENSYDHASGGDAIDQVQEEPKKSAKEIELIRKTEELRREEDEAKLKEQRRMEALAKANEARERKKRRAEKLQMRAELKIQKEAEEREKERERRLRKKERKNAAPTDAYNTNHNSEAALSSESAPEIIKDIIPNASSKKPQKPWTSSTKQKKSKSVPPPLRNRNKKKLQQWMWVIISSLIIIFLFWLGNIGTFLKPLSPVFY